MLDDVDTFDKKVIAQHEPGAKLDDDKVDMSLLEFLPAALIEICRVMDYGQHKYTRGGFLEVPDAQKRYTAAMWRHYLKEGVETFDTDPFYDTEIGLPWKGKIRHDAQVAVNAMFRLEHAMRKEQEDRDIAWAADQPKRAVSISVSNPFNLSEQILEITDNFNKESEQILEITDNFNKEYKSI